MANRALNTREKVRFDSGASKRIRVDMRLDFNYISLQKRQRLGDIILCLASDGRRSEVLKDEAER